MPGRPTPAQSERVRRFEAVIGLAAPALDVLLAIGDRISRVAAPADHGYYPIRQGPPVQLPGEEGSALTPPGPSPEVVEGDSEPLPPE